MLKIILLFAALARPELGVGAAISNADYPDMATCRAALGPAEKLLKDGLESRTGLQITVKGECHTPAEIDAIVKQLEKAGLIQKQSDPRGGQDI